MQLGELGGGLEVPHCGSRATAIKRSGRGFGGSSSPEAEEVWEAGR